MANPNGMNNNNSNKSSGNQPKTATNPSTGATTAGNAAPIQGPASAQGAQNVPGLGHLMTGLSGTLGYLFGSGKTANPNQGADIKQAATVEQANAAYENANNALAQQQAFVNALAAQGGIQNQSDVYNAYANLAQGYGPNPAQNMLNQATANNVANQAALMAGQRGAGANAGLIARQAANQGANAQQNAIGQAATMGANQQLNALQNAGNIAGQQVGNQGTALNAYNQNQQSEQQTILNAIAAYNNANVAMQSNLNTANSNLAALNKDRGLLGNVIGSVGGIFGGYEGGRVPKMAYGGMTYEGQHNDALSNARQQSNMSATERPMTAESSHMMSDNQSKLNIGQAKKAYEAISNLAEGGIAEYADNNNDAQNAAKQQSEQLAHNEPEIQSASTNGKQKNVSGAMKVLSTVFSALNEGGEVDKSANKTEPQSDFGQFLKLSSQQSANKMAKGGKVPALLSPGEAYVPPHKVNEVAKGKDPRQAGEIIPGKAKVKGDSLKNDTVLAQLDEGGIVIPRSIMNSKNPAKEASKFVAAILKKDALKAKKKS